MPNPEQAKPDEKAQRNFTDPDSRIIVDGANKGGFIQAYDGGGQRSAGDLSG